MAEGLGTCCREGTQRPPRLQQRPFACGGDYGTPEDVVAAAVAAAAVVVVGDEDERACRKRKASNCRKENLPEQGEEEDARGCKSTSCHRQIRSSC